MARKNVTFPDELYAIAEIRMKELMHPDFSGYLQQLVREDWTESRGASGFTKSPPDQTPVAPEKPHRVPQAQKAELEWVQRENDEKRARRGLPKRG